MEPKKHNKLFKSDSQRVAFLLCVGFSVYGGIRELRYCVAHTLTGRYKYAAEVNLAMSYSRMRKPHTTIGAITFHF